MELWDEVEELGHIDKKDKLSVDTDDLWDSVEEEGDLRESAEKIGNRYLENPNEALDLISKLFQRNQKANSETKITKRLDKLIYNQFLSIASSIRFKEDREIYQELLVLKENMNLPETIHNLLHKNVVAIAGGFSAGKSKFINSLIGYPVLPENQTPTTAVATYITNGPFEVKGITDRSNEVELDMEAFQAISHAFYQQYHVNLPAYIDKMIVQVPSLDFENITFIDTPGYTKADGFKDESQTDRQIAKQQLQIADFLIWLVDIDNGTVKNEDLKFITDLQFTKPILIIFNQADKKPLSYINQTIEKAYDAIKNKGFTNVYAIAAYSSLEEKEYTGKYIHEFLTECNHRNSRKTYGQPFQRLEEFIKSKQREMEGTKKVITDLISTASQLGQVGELLPLYLLKELELQQITEVQQDVDHIKKKLDGIIMNSVLHKEKGSLDK
ncbi:dynamin family protein [Cytobacillus massiliigabonensis]|uniref:dynamin family protein n=1 Tax=Cytobacillus massiliigabonensis TaxID=1871011 RepID=UPI000C81E804|nr:dynamin family protein [Cytobacillus massiliigabonensis]